MRMVMSHNISCGSLRLELEYQSYNPKDTLSFQWLSQRLMAIWGDSPEIPLFRTSLGGISQMAQAL